MFVLKFRKERVGAVHEDKHRNSPYAITFRTSARRIIKRPDIVYTASRNKNRWGARRIYYYIGHWWFILIYDIPRTRRDFWPFYVYIIIRTLCYYRRHLLFMIYFYSIPVERL